MERLTYTDKSELKPWVHSMEAIKRLKAYEATGLEPEAIEAMKMDMRVKSIAGIEVFEGAPIEHLRDLVRAEQEGRLVVTPLPVRVAQSSRGDGIKHPNVTWVPAKEFSKTVLEARAALKGENHETNL